MLWSLMNFKKLSPVTLSFSSSFVFCLPTFSEFHLKKIEKQSKQKNSEKRSRTQLLNATWVLVLGLFLFFEVEYLLLKLAG